MIKDNPNATPEVLNSLSREPIGQELATRVAVKLSKDNGRRGIWYTHRDYCGHGLVFLESQFRLVRVNDGIPAQGKVICAWDDKVEFVAWLSRQSDFSLCGADESEPALHTTDSWTVNNQRLNYSRLIKYVAADFVNPIFRQFLTAVGEEFEFLVIDYNFRLTIPEMCGHECEIAYIKPRVAGITITSEAGSQPFITVSLVTGDKETSYSLKLLDGMARQRRPDWKRPTFNSDNRTVDEFRRYLRQYALLLRNDFQDILTSERANVSQEPDSQSPPSRSDSDEPAESSKTSAARVSGALLVLAAFIVMVIELRYFTVNDTPEATGSAYGNLGMLIMMGLPWIVLVAGLLQLCSGVYIHKYDSAFSAMTLGKRLGISLGVLGLSVLLTGLAVTVSS